MMQEHQHKLIKKYYKGVKTMKKIRYYMARTLWLWKNRNWENTRQKFKAMKREVGKYEI